jgi:predicted dinucleotide-binding enzyme
MCPTLHRSAVALLAVVQRDRTRGRAQWIARELKTERVVHVFEAIFAEARNDRRVAVR